MPAGETTCPRLPARNVIARVASAEAFFPSTRSALSRLTLPVALVLKGASAADLVVSRRTGPGWVRSMTVALLA